ncbi:MAG: hypothetical protein DRO11_06550 [Methanobacteriota archaeon]|nr:MAG: hypothetical protein DRO11_06550 [Euryarchaeota archaeon]
MWRETWGMSLPMLPKHLVVTVTLLLFLAMPLCSGQTDRLFDVIIVRDDIPFDWAIASAYGSKTGTPVVPIQKEGLRQEDKILLSGVTNYVENPRVLIVGGYNAVSRNVENELRQLGYFVTRIKGSDRYWTAAWVAIDLWEKNPILVLMDGHDYGSLIAAQQVAKQHGSPILLTDEEDISSINALKRVFEHLHPEKVVVVVSPSGRPSDTTIGKIRGLGVDIQVVKPGKKGIPVLPTPPATRGYTPRNIYPTLVGSLLALLLGIFVGRWISYRRHRGKRLPTLPMVILTDDERRVVKQIMDHGGSLLQDQLPRLTGFSRPKISRVVSDLEDRGIVAKVRNGKTYRLNLMTEFVVSDRGE